MQINNMEINMETESMGRAGDSSDKSQIDKEMTNTLTNSTSEVESMELDGDSDISNANGENTTQDAVKGNNSESQVADASLTQSPTSHEFNAQNSVENSSQSDNFKKPVLFIGPRKGKPIKLKALQITESLSEKDITADNELRTEKEISTELQSEKEFKEEQKKKISLHEQIPLPYTEPSWSGKPKENYKLEVLKSGMIVEEIDLSERNYHVVGRLPTCHISLAHPTISRYHAIFQFRTVKDEKSEPGLYIYDLDSTHGTFWNGNRIRPNVYVRVQGGHIIKFGCSQRKFILQAPPDDQQEESELSVTELKERRQLELEEKERIEAEQRLEQEELESLTREKGESGWVDWGMREDADEESDLSENPYAQSNNEELFLDDPKKTLRGWFEREGHDLQYHTEDRGIGRFLCWVNLPIEYVTGGPARAEAIVAGKKKESVIQCALEACRILDRYGLLRQANHEARKRKAKNWEDDDFYDSDEDNFLDRTGSVEKKREHRMKMAGKLVSRHETYASILEKHTVVVKNILDLEKLIESTKQKKKQIEDSNEDALDAFMSTLDTSAVDKIKLTKIKLELQNLRKEEAQLQKLINIAKPTDLPPLQPCISNTTKSKTEEQFKNIKPLIGRKKKPMTSIKLTPSVVQSQVQTNPSDVVEEDEASDEEKEVSDSVEIEMKAAIVGENDVVMIPVSEDSTIIEENIEETKDSKDSLKLKKRNKKRMQQRQEKASKELEKNYESDKLKEDYSMWVPPQDQSGDGKTSLNEKYGY